MDLTFWNLSTHFLCFIVGRRFSMQWKNKYNWTNDKNGFFYFITWIPINIHQIHLQQPDQRSKVGHLRSKAFGSWWALLHSIYEWKLWIVLETVQQHVTWHNSILKNVEWVSSVEIIFNFLAFFLELGTIYKIKQNQFIA